VQGRKIGSGKRPALDRHEMQARAALRIVAPSLPGRQKIDTDAEAGLDNGEHTRTGPARRQIIALQEHVARLSDRRVGAMVDVGELR
jgi:hypothetical protein